MFSRREAASTDSHNTNVDDALIGDTVEHVIRKSTDELRVRGRSAPVAIRLTNNALSYWTNSVGSLADTDDDCRHIRIEDVHDDHERGGHVPREHPKAHWDGTAVDTQEESYRIARDEGLEVVARERERVHALLVCDGQ